MLGVKRRLADVTVVSWRLASLRGHWDCLSLLQNSVQVYENMGVQGHISGCCLD